MLKRWLSVNKSSKKRIQGKQPGVESHSQSNGNGDGLPSNIEISSKPLPNIKSGEKRKASSSSSNRQLSSTPSEIHSVNETFQSGNSASLDGLSDLDIPELLTAKVSEGLPFGEGSNKVFGYENFGNTCYCNSVLQCLYNIPEFRTFILQYPDRNPEAKRKRKYEMPGSKPRYFTESSFESNTSVNNSNDHHQKNKSHIPAGSTSYCNQNNCGNSCSGSTVNSSNNHSGDQTQNSNSERPVHSVRRNSSFMLGKHGKGGNHAINNDDTNQRHQNGFHSSHVKHQHTQEHSDSHSHDSGRDTPPVHATIMASDAISEKLHASSQKVIVGRPFSTLLSTTAEIEGANKHVATIEDTEGGESNVSIIKHHGNPQIFSSEQRKKYALLRGPVLNIDHLLNESGESNLLYSLKDIFESITENTCLTGVVSPIHFVEVLKRENILFNTTMHQDAHEFLNFLLNQLSDYIQNDINKSPKPDENENFINILFQGTLINSIKCLTCDNTTSRIEPFLDFPVEVKDDEETDIQAVLQGYRQREMLSGSNKFYCDECCGLQEAERVVGLKQLPRILALHLKRFKYSEKQNCNIKLFNRVRYPLILNVRSIFSNISKTYELTGIVVHMGGGPQHGHYVSLCKNENFGWLLFDDETVESVSDDTVLKFVGCSHTLTTAYVLFYKEIAASKESISSSRLLKQKEIEENLDKLIKYDDLITEISQKAKTPVIVEADTTEEVSEMPMPRFDFERNTSTSSSTGKARPKSRLFNFMKN